MREAETIAHLRASLAKAGLETPEKQACIPLGHVAADTVLKGGLVRGALHEIFSASAGHEAAATGFTAGLAARIAAEKTILWIGQDFSALEFGEISATGFLELGLDPSRILLLRAATAEDAVRAASDALGCTALGAVVIEIPASPRILDLVTSRRLTLAAAQSNVPAFLLRLGAEPDASAAETRWSIRAEPSQKNNAENWGYPIFRTDLVRNRHGGTGHWVMEWDCDDGVFRKPRYATDHVVVVSPSGDGPLTAALETKRRSIA